MKENEPIKSDWLATTNKMKEFIQFQYFVRKSFKDLIEHLSVEYTTEMENIFRKFPDAVEYIKRKLI